MKTLYLIQAAASLPQQYKELESDYVLLSYKEQTDQTDIYLPNSTWTEGRNKLREFVISQNKLLNGYDFFCFMDEDLIATDRSMKNKQPWRIFEQEVYKINPAICLPVCWNYNKGINRYLRLISQPERRTAEQQNSRTAEQQNSRTAEQQNSRTAEQQNANMEKLQLYN